MQFFETVKAIGDLVVKAIRTEIVLQGHQLTGALESSLEAQERIVADGAVIAFLMNDYGQFVNTGTPAPVIPYTPGQARAKVSKYIEGLKRYAKIRFRVTEAQALSIAFAIAKKHKKEGNPTRASRRFSRTGKRTQYIEAALQKIDSKIVELLNKLEDGLFDSAAI